MFQINLFANQRILESARTMHVFNYGCLFEMPGFEMQFGMKQPLNYSCRQGKLESQGIESKSIPGYTDNIRL